MDYGYIPTENITRRYWIYECRRKWRRQGRTKELSLYLCVDGKRLFGISEQSWL